jgi:hypothetical protein
MYPDTLGYCVVRLIGGAQDLGQLMADTRYVAGLVITSSDRDC